MKIRKEIENNQESPTMRMDKRTWIENIFQGMLATSITCNNCNARTENHEPFFELPIDLNTNFSLRSSINFMEKTEIMEGDNKYYCDNCGNMVEAEKLVQIKTLPGT